MRKSMTEQEVKLWVQLKYLRKQGHHFRRQVPFQNYILDFVCYASKLVIEIDGGQHNEQRHHARDQARDKVLQGEGFTVLRFWNNEIDHNIEGVMEKIIKFLATPPLPGASRPPP